MRDTLSSFSKVNMILLVLISLCEIQSLKGRCVGGILDDTPGGWPGLAAWQLPGWEGAMTCDVQGPFVYLISI